MARRTFDREAWVQDVLRADVSEPCKVLLLAMATQMTARGYVSVPRTTLAEMIGRHEQRVAERIGEAKQAGLLGQVGGGFRGRTAEYVAQRITANAYGQAVPIGGTHCGCEPGAMGTATATPNTRARARARTTEVPASVSEFVAVPHHDETAIAGVSGADNVADRDATAPTIAVDTPRASMVEVPADRGSAERHGRTAGARLAGLSPGAGRRLVCADLRSNPPLAWKRPAAA